MYETKVIGENVLVEPKNSSGLVVKTNKGTVIRVGGKVQEVKVNDVVIFGEDKDDLDLVISGTKKSLHLMPESNIKIIERWTEEVNA